MDRPQHELRIQTICLMILAGVAIGGGLYWMRAPRIPFVIALFVAVGLKPLIGFSPKAMHTGKTKAKPARVPVLSLRCRVLI